ncbi:S49 family peptidase [Actinokineospora sp. G85]|uniref:S49 family peptidase n=1 Tax=Actinokineospora sp. G85 TaxID=3406626 RepID=UPI003C765AA7
MGAAGKLVGRLAELRDKPEKEPVVAVVRLQGVISAAGAPIGRGVINVSTVEGLLKRAFGKPGLVAVAVVINSPGGAPTQSALVGERIRELAAEKDVPVLAFCEDIAASGGYWLACAGDEIYAHATSQVGSIGVISTSFGLDGLLDRFGVQRRVYAAGANKARLDPFRPESEEDVRWLRGLQDELHGLFIDWVRERRGDRLKGTPEQLFSGEVWTGAKALELGLVDGLGSVRSIIGKRFPDAEIVVNEPKKTLLDRLPIRAGDRVLGALDAIEARVAWSRFGL